MWGLWAQVNDITGWVAAVSTVGLLGPVLYWLCYVHLPAKDKQVKELLEMYGAERERDRVARHQLAQDFQKIIADISEGHDEEIAKTRDEFKQALTTITEHCERETSRLLEAFRVEMGKPPRARQGQTPPPV